MKNIAEANIEKKNPEASAEELEYFENFGEGVNVFNFNDLAKD